MSSSRIQIPHELFAPAESFHFEGELTLSAIDAGPDQYGFAHPIVWAVDITNTGEALLVAGEAKGLVVTSCARCLDDVTMNLIGSIEGYFLLNGDSEEPEGMDDDEFEVLPEDKTIDLEPLIIAALLVEFPLVPLCDEQCAGLCSSCGANLNQGDCDCVVIDDDEFQKNSFAALKNFTFDKNK